MTITHEQLKEVGKGLLDKIVKNLPKVIHSFHLVTKDSVEIYVVDPNLINSPRAKSDISRQLKERIAKGDVDAVLSVHDTYYTSKIPDDPVAQSRARMALELGVSVPVGQKMGLWGMGEAILVLCEAKDGYTFSLRQNYMRHPDNIAETMLEDYVEDEGWKLRGRFGGWFENTKQQD